MELPKSNLKFLTDREAGQVEGFAAAMDRVFEFITHDQRSGKSYDPMTVSEDRTTMHSYAFDMKDGGRHHPVSDYASVREILDTLFMETISEMAGDAFDKAHSIRYPRGRTE